MSAALEQMNLNLLLSLDALLAEQNVTRAAKKLGVTQGAMSRNLGSFDPALAEGVLRVAAPGHMAALIGPDLVKRLEREAPKLRLRLEQLDAAHIVHAIESGVDLALGPTLDLGSAVRHAPVYQDQFACLVSADHPDVPGDAIDLATYLACAHVLISDARVQWILSCVERSLGMPETP